MKKNLSKEALKKEAIFWEKMRKAEKNKLHKICHK